MYDEMMKQEKLTEKEREAVREWFSDHKDELPGELKSGLKKLISNDDKNVFMIQEKTRNSRGR